MKRLILMVVVAILSGCFAPSPYEVKIEGTIFHEGKAANEIKVRFTSNNPETSENQGLEATTDQEGKFFLTQTYKPTWFEKVDVLIHPYRLSIFLDGRWQTAWRLTTGPAPRSVVFKCFLDGQKKKVEKCLVSWDKQPFR